MRVEISRGHQEVLDERRRLLGHQEAAYRKSGTIRDVLLACGVSQRFALIKRRLFDEMPAHKRALLVADNMFDSLTDMYGIFLSGATRSGKTSLAAVMLRLAVAKELTVRFLTYDDYVNHIRQRVNISQLADKIENVGDWLSDWYDETWRLTSVIEVLVLDDLGRMGVPEFIKQEILSFVRSRGDNGLYTIITTNLSPQQLRGSFDDRFVEYIRTEYHQETFGPEEKVK